MKKIEIVFTRSKKFIPVGSWFIRFYTGKPYSHVAKSSNIREWGNRYFQASEGKVNYEYEEFFHKKHYVVKRFILEVPDEIDRLIKEACYKEAGNNYGVMQNIGIILVDLCGLFGYYIKNPFKKGRNCSELIYTKVIQNLIECNDYNPDTIKPHHIEKILREKCGEWVVAIEEERCG